MKRVIPPKVNRGVTDSLVARRPSTLFHSKNSTSGQSSVSGQNNGYDGPQRRFSMLSVLDECEEFHGEQLVANMEAVSAETGNKTILLTGSENHSYKNGLDSFLDSKVWNNGSVKSCDGITHAALVKDFIKEMRHLSKLRHPAITTVMGAVFESNDSEPALVMECMTRGSLHDILHNTTVAIDGSILLPILQDVCRGLRFLHCADPPILHGDLKSANILVDDRFRAKVSVSPKAIGITSSFVFVSLYLLYHLQTIILDSRFWAYSKEKDWSSRFSILDGTRAFARRKHQYYCF